MLVWKTHKEYNNNDNNNHNGKIKTNRQDIVIKDYKRKIYLLIDMSVSTDNKISVKEYNEISKYKHLEIDFAKMWYYYFTSNSGSTGYDQERDR